MCASDCQYKGTLLIGRLSANAMVISRSCMTVQKKMKLFKVLKPFNPSLIIIYENIPIYVTILVLESVLYYEKIWDLLHLIRKLYSYI